MAVFAGRAFSPALARIVRGNFSVAAPGWSRKMSGSIVTLEKNHEKHYATLTMNRFMPPVALLFVRSLALKRIGAMTTGYQ